MNWIIKYERINGKEGTRSVKQVDICKHLKRLLRQGYKIRSLEKVK